VNCIRTFAKVLAGNCILLNAKWEFAAKTYEELAVIGLDNDKISFRSFTFDGKNSKDKLQTAQMFIPKQFVLKHKCPQDLHAWFTGLTGKAVFAGQ
jgi:hypothetical protein